MDRIIAHREADRKWREAHPDQKRESRREWREKHPEYGRVWREEHLEQIREYARKWHKEYPNKTREYSHKWNAEHLEQKRECDRNWRTENPEESKKRTRRWREEHPDKAKECVREWGKRHPEQLQQYRRNRRAKKVNAGGAITAEEWQSVLEKYGNKCLCCGTTENLTMDHVIPLDPGPHTANNVQPLCRICNSSKGRKTIDYRGECHIKRAI